MKNCHYIVFGVFIVFVLPHTVFCEIPDVHALKEMKKRFGWHFDVGENGVTQFDLKSLTGAGISKKDSFNIKEQSYAVDQSKDDFNLPEEFDWRQVADNLTPVKHQGYKCGSCWAFSAIAQLESKLKIIHGDSMDLSEQEIISCAVPQSVNGCLGVDIWFAQNYFMTQGVSSSSRIPYKQTKSQINVPCENISGQSNHQYKIKSWGYVSSWKKINPNEIKKSLITYGPLVSSLYANSSFQAYKGGSLSDETACMPILHPQNQAVFDASYIHDVLIVGWTKNNEWIIKNSWGTRWGEKGYGRIGYNCLWIGYHHVVFSILPEEIIKE